MGMEHEPDGQHAMDVTLARLEDQITWYDRKSANNQRWHLRLKLATFTSAAVIPFFAAVGAPAVVGGGLGVLVVIFEGLQQMFQFHQNWVTYRATCEQLKHEKYLFLATAGPYADAPYPRRMLAERVEALVSTETAKWVANATRTESKDEGRKLTV